MLCNVIGVPKSIDNDILLIDKCFGFDTAVEEAQRALLAAKVEASSARRGVGLVKLMGRQSGFIAMQASMASGGGTCWAGLVVQQSAAFGLQMSYQSTINIYIKARP